MSLRARMALIVATAVVVLVAIGGALFTHQLGAGLERGLDTSLRVRADALLERDSLSDFPSSGLLPADEAFTQVIDATGRVVSSSGGGGDPLLTSPQLAAARQRSVAAVVSRGDDSLRILAVPAPNRGVLVVGTSREAVITAVDQTRTWLVLGGAVAAVLSAAGAWLVAGAALRPVENMRAEAERITAGEPDARLAVPATKDEVARLGHTFNALLARLHHALDQQREFVADAGHELRTPLALLRGELELAGRPGRSREDMAAAIVSATQDADRLIRLAEDLLLIARYEGAGSLPPYTPVRLNDVVADAVAARAGAVEIDAPAPVVVAGDPDRLRQVVDNLLDNALRFAPPGSVVSVGLAAVGGRAVLEVSDQGSGLPAEFLPHAFERFRRADTARNDGGTGLGLSIVASLVEAHGGTVTAENRPEGGARLRVELPQV